jgi:hypothetical protein
VPRFAFVEPGLTSPRSSGLSNQSSMNSVRSLRPILLSVAPKRPQRSRWLDCLGFGAAGQPNGITPMLHDDVV